MLDNKGAYIDARTHNDLYAKDIHPSLLNGLIPVDRPAFIGKDGAAHACRSQRFEYENKHFDELSSNDLPLINKVVEEMTNQNWQYFLSIQHYPLNKYYVIRGC